jgi:hypothetical protein
MNEELDVMCGYWGLKLIGRQSDFYVDFLC